MTTTEEILTAIPTLSQEDLVSIHQRCEALLAHTSVEKEEEDWLLVSIIEEIKLRGLSATIPDYFKIKKRNSYAGYIRKSEEIRKQLERTIPASFPISHKKVHCYALGKTCVTALADYLLLTQPYRELSLDQMLRQVDQLPLALEEAYPGYWASGLLSFLLKTQTDWSE